MENQWNFHNYIAIPLERYSQKYTGNRHTTADDIDLGAFVSTMFDVLLAVYGSLSDLGEFAAACQKYDGLSHNDIPDKTSQELFTEFERLIHAKT